MALTHRCSPLSHYYIAIVQDSPGYKARPNASGTIMGETVSNKWDPPASPPPSPQATSRNVNSRTIIYKYCEPTLIDTLIVGADVSIKHTLNDTLNSNSSKYVNLLLTH